MVVDCHADGEDLHEACSNWVITYGRLPLKSYSGNISTLMPAMKAIKKKLHSRSNTIYSLLLIEAITLFSAEEAILLIEIHLSES